MNECMNSNQWLPPKGMGSIKKKISKKRNGLHSKEWLHFKGMASTKDNGFH